MHALLFPALLEVVAANHVLVASPFIQNRQSAENPILCDQASNITEGTYTLSLNEFGVDNANNGSQCARVLALNDSSISWATNWTWNGGDEVKSFSNVNFDPIVGRTVRSITNLPTTWEWSYDLVNTSIVNVAYDLITSSSTDGGVVNEILIWLAGFNTQPVSSMVDAQGNAIPVARNINAHGSTWNLFAASIGTTSIFTFLPTNATIQSFHSDLNVFLKFLILNVGLDEAQIVKLAQAGTEVTSGSGNLIVSEYSLDII